MGLTAQSTGKKAAEKALFIKNGNHKTIALAGNPNVGKSTLFNLLTGARQHTGNWPGKTVTGASGTISHNGNEYNFIDLPGTYSLMAHSCEEEVARDYICFENPDAVIVVCDATALERNLNLAMQCLEISSKTLICVNLMDEAEKKGIKINLKLLSQILGVPVVGISARKEKGIDRLMDELEKLLSAPENNFFEIKYNPDIEAAAKMIFKGFPETFPKDINPKWAALKILENDINLTEKITGKCGGSFYDSTAAKKASEYLESKSVPQSKISDIIVKSIILNAEAAANSVIYFKNAEYAERDKKFDSVLTGRLTGIPIMLLTLMMIFWITIYAANIPSAMLSEFLFSFENKFFNFLCYIKLPHILAEIVVFGMYRVLAWVVAVMLPPMAIFFPLFTFLEDLGYLPRIAFNLDGIFKKCGACGKQALTMCMGFGCNAAGAVGCRIIDSPRERLIAILTNTFVPCNGRFPMLISIITVFFTAYIASPLGSVAGALILTGFICLGVAVTFLVSYILAKTLLEGTPSSFTLELPPYRRPQIMKIILRSICDRIRFVLTRAAAVAAPAGAVIWFLANATVAGKPLLGILSDFLNPFASLMGLDGAILLAFLLGLPANEIVIPILIMIYTASGTLTEINNIESLRQILLSNGWNFITAVNMLIFSVIHWPCSTTLITIKKETQSIKWTILAFIVPALAGFLLCFLSNAILSLLL